jgi:VanZ family protein
VQNRTVFFKFWLPVVVWCALIFVASADSNSSQNSSRLLGPLLKWLVPSLSDAAIADAVFFARKCVHATVYAVLAWLLWRALRVRMGSVSGWCGRAAWWAWIGATGYAVSDELHQSFVANRQGSVWDVALDSAGAAACLVLVRFWFRRKRKPA